MTRIAVGRALISVSDKRGLTPFAAGLVDQGGPVVLFLLALSLVAAALIAAKLLQFLVPRSRHSMWVLDLGTQSGYPL